MLWLCAAMAARVPQPIQQLLAKPYMRGASFSLLIKETESGRVVCAYDTLRQLTPASVMKLVTTATALELKKTCIFLVISASELTVSVTV